MEGQNPGPNSGPVIRPANATAGEEGVRGHGAPGAEGDDPGAGVGGARGEVAQDYGARSGARKGSKKTAAKTIRGRSEASRLFGPLVEQVEEELVRQAREQTRNGGAQLWMSEAGARWQAEERSWEDRREQTKQARFLTWNCQTLREVARLHSVRRLMERSSRSR